MSNGFPSPWEVYAVLPYQFPLFEQQPVVRIPVAGPDPFNTVVVVRGFVPTQEFGVSDNVLHRYRHAVMTNFQLVGFDPRVPPPFKHSTTAAIQMMQADDDTAFVVAVDQVVDGLFDDHGNWILVFDVAGLWDHVYAASGAYFSSWILCYEPPPNPNLPRAGRLKFENYGIPPRHSTIKRELGTLSDADRRLDTYLKRNRRRKERKLNKCCPEKKADSNG
jgi:hypothetical protein